MQSSLSLRQVLLAIVLAPALATLAVAHSNEPLFKITASDSFEKDQFGISVAISGSTAIVGAVGTAAAYPWERDRAHDFPGAAYVIDVSTGQELRKLTASDGSARDEFGHSVAINGSFALVGSLSESAYLFDWVTGQQLHKLTPSGGESRDKFGTAVALDNGVALVGAPTSDRTGYAVLFDVATGEERMRLTPLDSPQWAWFGESVAISGSLAVIGAPYDPHAGYGSGSAYVFDLTTGTQLRKLTAANAQPGSLFGSSVSMDGNRALVGAYGEGVPGATYLFDLTTGEELMKIPSPAGDDPNYRFGTTVVLRNNMALSGAPDDGEEVPSSGTAYVFDIATGEQLHKLKAADGRQYDHMGYSVAMDGLYMVTGVTPDRGDQTPGAIYVFSLAPEPSSALLIGLAGILLSVLHRPQARYTNVMRNASCFGMREQDAEIERS